MTDDNTFDSFLDQLSHTPAVTDYFLHQCRARYEAGVHQFRTKDGDPLYLNRDNAREGMEEAADGANYAIMESLKRIANGKEDKRDIALKAAHHFAQAHFALIQLQAADG